MIPFGGTLIYLAQYGPMVLVWLAGTILALTTWRQHPNVSRFTLIALAIFFVELLISAFTSLYAPVMLRERGWTASQLQIWYTFQNGIFSLISAAAWVCIFAAIFGRRDKP